MNRAKIIATVGPATESPEMLQKLMEAGVNVFRLNFSHATPEIHAERVDNIRAIAKKLKKSVAILGDLQGPKIRTGLLEVEPTILETGSVIELTTDKIKGTPERISVDFEEFPNVVKEGMDVLLCEGLIRLKALSVDGNTVKCEVVRGGELGERKGINMIGVKLASALTEKDKVDVRNAIKKQVDYVALSFVRNAADVQGLKAYMNEHGGELPIIAKIEKPEAVEDLESILEEVEGVMVARGDLGVETDLEHVPVIQKNIIKMAHRKGKPVITATQMLESMIKAPSPTRAEVTDVANAVFDGTCAVMLSGETAVGDFPDEVIRTMRRIVEAAEESEFVNYNCDKYCSERTSSQFAVAHSSVNAAKEANTEAIVVFTLSGETAKVIANRRPDVPIFAFTPYENVYNRMALWWGVTPILTKFEKNINVAIRRGEETVIEQDLLKKGDRVVLVFGPTEIEGNTNQMKIITLGEPH